MLKLYPTINNEVYQRRIKNINFEAAVAREDQGYTITFLPRLKSDQRFHEGFVQGRLTSLGQKEADLYG